MSTKILVECPQLIASVRVGVLEPLRPIEQAGLCTVRYRDTKDITSEDISWCDIMICVRGCEYATLHIVREARKHGRFVIYFLDDDLLCVPRGNISTDYYSDYVIQANLTEILSYCNVLWAVNQMIIEKYERWCPRSILMRAPTDILCDPPAVKSPLQILYAGSVDHSELAREILTPAVQRILNEYPGQVEFTFIGANPGIGHMQGITYYSYFENYDTYRKRILSGEYAIGLAPARNTQFYASKYYNKFIEYSSYGIAGIYADCAPYTMIVKNGENGLLCGFEFDAWYYAIKELIENPLKASYYALNAGKLLREEFSYQAVSQRLQLLLPEIIGFQAPDKKSSEIRLPTVRWLFYSERMRLLCRMYGALAVLIIPWKVVRKILKWLFKK